MRHNSPRRYAQVKCKGQLRKQWNRNSGRNISQIYVCVVRARSRTDWGTIRQGIKDLLVGVQGQCVAVGMRCNVMRCDAMREDQPQAPSSSQAASEAGWERVAGRYRKWKWKWKRKWTIKGVTMAEAGLQRAVLLPCNTLAASWNQEQRRQYTSRRRQ